MKVVDLILKEFDIDPEEDKVIDVKIDDVKIVSSNNRLIKTKEGRFCSSPEWKACLKRLSDEFYYSRGLIPDESDEFFVYLGISHGGDLDNYEKVVYDALEKGQVIPNDKQIICKYVEKIEKGIRVMVFIK